MNCHESLMARRRKKSKAAAQAKARDKDGSPMITDKSLPALPPNAVPLPGFSTERVTPESDTPTELSPRPRAAYGRNESSSRSSSRPDRSPERAAESVKEPTLAPPAQNYRNNRNSTIVSGDLNNGDDGFFIPVALDTNSAAATPQSVSDAFTDAIRKNKDYFPQSRSAAPAEKKPESQSSTPHIAFQEKGRQASSDYESPQPLERPTRKLSKRTDRNGNPKPSPSIGDERKISSGKAPGSDDFKLQDAPKSKKLVSHRSNSLGSNSIEGGKGPNGQVRGGPSPSGMASSPMLGVPDNGPTPRSSQDLRVREDDSIRPSMDSIASGRSESGSKTIARKELPPSASRNRKWDEYFLASKEQSC